MPNASIGGREGENVNNCLSHHTLFCTCHKLRGIQHDGCIEVFTRKKQGAEENETKGERKREGERERERYRRSCENQDRIQAIATAMMGCANVDTMVNDMRKINCNPAAPPGMKHDK